jgi:hypothetical protein
MRLFSGDGGRRGLLFDFELSLDHATSPRVSISAFGSRHGEDYKRLYMKLAPDSTTHTVLANMSALDKNPLLFPGTPGSACKCLEV